MTAVGAVFGLVVPVVGVVLLGTPGLVHRLVPARGRQRSARRWSARRSNPHPRSRAGLPAPMTLTHPSATTTSTSRQRSRPPSDTEVAQWCDALARRLRTGDTLVGAVRSVPTAPTLDAALRPMLLGLDRGADLATAAPLARSGTAAMDLAITVLMASARLGGPAAEPIDRAAAAIRRRAADEAERRAQSAQARASALTLTALPGAVLMLLVVSSSDVRAQLSEPLGATSVGLGVALNLAGWRWMRRIVEGSP